MIKLKDMSAKDFEILVKDYLSTLFPQLSWESTGQSHDGNKDYIAKFFDERSGLESFVWAEVKHSNKENDSIPKSHLDSTLVSVYLDKRVQRLIFVTNAKISEEFKLRTDRFLRNRHIKVSYYANENLQEWYRGQKLIDRISLNVYGVYSDNNDYLGRKVESVEEGYDYSLFFEIYSTSELIVNVSVDSAVVIRENNFIVEKGATSFELPFFIKNNCQIEKLTFHFQNDMGEKIGNFEIPMLKRFNPIMNISSQKNVLVKIENILNYSSSYANITVVLANSGMGKTFVLKQLKRDFAYKGEILIFTFKNNDAENILIFSQIFIGFLLGKVYDLDIEAIDKLINGRYNNLKDLIFLLYNYINKVEGIVATQVADAFRNLITNRKNYPFNLYVNDRLIVLLDDCQKISEDISDIFLFIINILQESSRVNAVLFSRKNENEYNSNCIYNYFNKELIPIECNGIDSKDIVRSIKENFTMPNFINEDCELNLPISSVIQLENFLKLLKSESCQNHTTDPTAFIQLMNTVLRKNRANDLLRFTQNRDLYSSILTIIYNYELGVEQSWLNSYFGNTIYDFLEQLYVEKIIRLDGSKIFPYHDTMLELYQKNCNPLQNEYKKFIHYLIENSLITQTEGLFYLIKCIDGYIINNLTSIIQLRDKFYYEANYSSSISLGKILQDFYNKRNMINNEDYNANRFILADSLKYISSYAEANKILNEICRSHELESDLKYLIKTEIINNCIWMVDLILAKNILNEIVSITKYKASELLNNKRMTFAYLNYYNRYMFLTFMLKDGEQEKQLELNLEKCDILKREDYRGFAFMDYAKGIYLLDRQKATSYLCKALEIFTQLPNCKRRELDCLSDIAFLNGLGGLATVDKLYAIAKKMKKNKYNQSFFKTRLKAAVLRIIQGTDDINAIGDEVLSLQLMYPDLNTSKRMKMVFCHVLALVEYLKGNINLSIEYSREHYKIAKLFEASSYRNIPKHNMTLKTIKNIKLGEPTMDDGFAVDYRIW